MEVTLPFNVTDVAVLLVTTETEMLGAVGELDVVAATLCGES